MSSKGTVTMQEIADAAGVSKMTVSRALKDHPHQSNDTKERIRKIAEELGYSPHPYVSALMSQRARTVSDERRIPLAIFCFSSPESVKRHLYFKGIQEQCFKLGYKPELFQYEPEKLSPQRLRDILMARGIRGIILMPANRSFEKLDFDFKGFAVIAMGHTIVTPQLPRVGGDIQAAVFLALDKMVARDYRRIGLVNTDTVNQMSRYMYVAALAAYKRYSVKKLHLADLSIPLSGNEASASEICDWVRRKNLDGVISSSFDLNLLNILEQGGFRVPHELGFVYLLYHENDKITRIKQPAMMMGIKAVNQITAAINQNDYSATQAPYLLALAPEWHEGQTIHNRTEYPHPTPC